MYILNFPWWRGGGQIPGYASGGGGVGANDKDEEENKRS